jgi:hypothetical protein
MSQILPKSFDGVVKCRLADRRNRRAINSNQPKKCVKSFFFNHSHPTAQFLKSCIISWAYFWALFQLPSNGILKLEFDA